jgi:Zn-dependent protease
VVQDGDAMVAQRSPLDMFLLAMFHLNIGLAFFNLLPIPPLDGYRLLPRALESFARPLERYGFALLIGAFLLLPSGVTTAIFRPMFIVMNTVQSLFGVA